MARRRLLFVVNDTTFFVSHRLALAVAAREAGFEIDLAALDSGGLDEVRAQGIAFHPLAVDRTGINPARDVRLFWQLLGLVRTLRPSLMHTVTIKPVIYGGIAARLLRVPSLVSAVSGLGSVFVDADRTALLVRSIARGLYRLALAHPHSCAIFQNPQDRDQMIGANLITPQRTVLIRGSGVDVDVFRSVPEPEGTPVAIMPARLVWPKGVREFVEAARLLHQSGVGIRMALVGEPPAHNRASVPRAEIEAWVEQGLVEWWGHRSDMPRVYAGCHIVCLPSFYGEGLPQGADRGCGLRATDRHHGHSGLPRGRPRWRQRPARGAAGAGGSRRGLADARWRSQAPGRDGRPGAPAGDHRVLARSRDRGDLGPVRAPFGQRRSLTHLDRRPHRTHPARARRLRRSPDRVLAAARVSFR